MLEQCRRLQMCMNGNTRMFFLSAEHRVLEKMF